MMKNFLVHLKDTRKVYDDETSRATFNLRMKDLMRENILQQLYQSEAQDEFWMIFSTEDLEMLKLIIEPMIHKWDFEAEITPLRRKD